MKRELPLGTAAFAALGRVGDPKIASVVARGAGLSFVIFGIGVFFLPWQQTSKGTGEVIAYSPVEREQALKATISGQIAQWHVQEGSRVSKGDLVVELADNDPRIIERLAQERDAESRGRAAAQISVEAMASQIDALERGRELALSAADARIRMSRNKVSAAAQKLSAAEAALTAAKLNEERQKQLAGEGLTARRDMELAERDRAKAEAAMYSARAGLEGARAELLAKRAEREQVAAETDAKIAKTKGDLQKAYGEEAKAEASVAKAEVKLSRQSQMEVRAPRNGVIVRVLAKQGGEFVKAGAELALLVPDTARRAVALWIDGNDAPLVTPGREVRLQFEGWPAVQFSGWPSVAVGTFGGRVDFVDATADKQGRFRVLVVPGPHHWPNPTFLRQGVRSSGWILLSRVSVGYEIWRKLNGFPPRIEPKELKGTPWK